MEHGLTPNFNKGSIQSMKSVAEKVLLQKCITLDHFQDVAFEIILPLISAESVE